MIRGRDNNFLILTGDSKYEDALISKGINDSELGEVVIPGVYVNFLV